MPLSSSPTNLYIISGPSEKRLVSRLIILSILILLTVALQYPAYAQESAPQTRLSSRGLAYVNLSTSPANPTSGHTTLLLLQFLDPQSRAPRADIYYKIIIRNETAPVFILPGGSTIAGEVGIPYNFENPGSYNVEVDLNDTDITKSAAGSLDNVTFPIYVSKGVPDIQNGTVADSPQQTKPVVHIEAQNDNSYRPLMDVALIAVAAGIGAFLFRKRSLSKRRGLAR